jgi:hypothetical protein
MELLPQPFPVNEYGAVTVAHWGGWIVQVLPMLYNDRLVLTPEQHPLIYDYGWCYPKGPAAILAAHIWDPEMEAEPVGYIKAILPGRRAGQTAADGSPGEGVRQMWETVLGIDLS